MVEWTRWFEHDGNSCPAAGCYAQVVAANGFSTEGIVSENCARPIPSSWTAWLWKTIPARSYEYRVVKFRLRRDNSVKMLEELLLEPEKADKVLI